jgi:hypothetical protein
MARCNLWKAAIRILCATATAAFLAPMRARSRWNLSRR